MKINSVLYMPDGNHRFAMQKCIPLEVAYYLGGKVLEILVDFFLGRGLVNVLILHALSDYTHNRTDGTTVVMYDVMIRLFKEWSDIRYFSKKEINVRIINHSQKLPKDLKEVCDDLIKQNQEIFEKEIVILLGYSLSEDINVALSTKPENYQELREQLLFSDIDLVIRTMEMRPSSGPVYAMAQSQMIILNKLNPEVTVEDLDTLWKEYCKFVEYRISTNAFHSSSLS